MEKSDRFERQILDILFAEEAETEDRLYALRGAYAYVMSTTCADCRLHHAEFLASQVRAILELANMAAEAQETKH
jgi:hypothetical protein